MTNRTALALVLFVAAGICPPAASAQPGARPALDVFLEQRVAEELAADGTILSRLGVALDIEIVGDKLLVSLVDPATRRAVASTKMDKVPADREAAVASVTQVTANLAAQLNNNPANANAQAVKTVLEEERAERRAREEAEFRYKQEAITFSDLFVATTDGKGSTSVSRTLLAYRGGRALAPDEFFLTVDRVDLANAYRTRRKIGWGAMIGGAVLTGVGMYLVLGPGLYTTDFGTECYTDPNRAACEAAVEARNETGEREARKYMIAGLATGGTALVLSFVGLYYLYRSNPVSEHEVHDLADQYNAKLRQKYQLPGASASSWRPRVHELAISPVVTGEGGGFALSGRF